MGGPMLPAGSAEVCMASIAVIAGWFFLRFYQATRTVLALKTLPGRKHRYQIIALYSFISAPFAYWLFLLPLGYHWRIPALRYSQFIGLALFPVFIVYGLINLGRARDVGRLEQCYNGIGKKR